MTFIKGETGNAGGRPKTLGAVVELARQQDVKSINTLAELLDHSDPNVRIRAANSLLDRGYGKPAQSVTVSGDKENPLCHAIDRPERESRAEWEKRIAEKISNVDAPTRSAS